MDSPNERRTTNIFLAGVGGQGILLAGEILCLAFLEEGLDVKKSEVHGMAQRGGAVTSHVRAGERIFSPLIPRGRADVLVGFEPLEALRWSSFLKEDGLLLVNAQEIHPTTVTSGGMTYPEGILDLVRARRERTKVLDGLALARRAGNARTVNSVILGALSRELEIPEGTWTRVLRRRLPERLVEVNLAAFELGRTA